MAKAKQHFGSDTGGTKAKKKQDKDKVVVQNLVHELVQNDSKRNIGDKVND